MDDFRPSSGKTYEYGCGRNLEIVNQDTLKTATNINIGRSRSLFDPAGAHFRNYNNVKSKSSRRPPSLWWNGLDAKRKRRIFKYKYYAVEGKGTRVDIESGRLHGGRDVSAACLISFICNCKGFELLFNPKKRALAAFFVILEAISSFLDGFQKSQRIIRIVAFLLSVLGFLMTLLTGISERNSMANRVQAEKQLRAVEIGFSVVQLIATFMALVGTKIMNNYMSSILLVFFAVIAYGSTFVKDEGGSDTSGVENSTSSIELLHIASNANEIDEQLHIASTPNEIGEHSDLANTSNEMDDTEISQPLLSMLINIGNMNYHITSFPSDEIDEHFGVASTCNESDEHFGVASTCKESDEDFGVASTCNKSDEHFGVASTCNESDEHFGVASTCKESDEHFGVASTCNESDERFGVASTCNESDEHFGVASTGNESD
ncbi:hypothetical protein Patl1_22282 [Pistacia atlantica]|uniref:Uncharacterized protein n=1 Tax=Pistacia atlantica TaxID=434234 RepID=A0ACC0ZVI6_9ROSI|nr:hypothetical protein Patl1_22282 [Pistacia atlantica]